LYLQVTFDVLEKLILTVGTAPPEADVAKSHDRAQA
jgi:hypothetical protein